MTQIPAVSKCQTVLKFTPVPDEMKKERQDSEPFMKLQGIQFEEVYSEVFALLFKHTPVCLFYNVGV